MIDIQTGEIHAETTSVSRFLNYLVKSRREIRIWDAGGWESSNGLASSTPGSSSGLGGLDSLQFEIIRLVDFVPKRKLWDDPEVEHQFWKLVASSLEIQEKLVRTADVGFDPPASEDPVTVMLQDCHTADSGSNQPPEVVRFALVIGDPDSLIMSQLQDFAEQEDIGLVRYSPKLDQVSQILNIRRKRTCQKQPFKQLHQMELGSNSNGHR